jgi:hypothetical protein
MMSEERKLRDSAKLLLDVATAGLNVAVRAMSLSAREATLDEWIDSQIDIRLLAEEVLQAAARAHSAAEGLNAHFSTGIANEDSEIHTPGE